MSKIRLDKLLANLGYGSRREIAFLVREELVTLHGEIITSPDTGIALTDAAALLLEGQPIDPPSPLTIMLNKPPGYTCSADERGALVYDLLPPRYRLRKPVLSCAGRLDKESTGQVIMTDDGDLLHKIIHPKSHASKHYAVTLENPLDGNETALFATGDFRMKGDPKPLKPAEWIADDARTGRMILHEGRYHQIRRMFETLGNKVIGLHRFQTGALAIGDLASGQYRQLEAVDIGRIFYSVN